MQLDLVRSTHAQDQLLVGVQFAKAHPGRVLTTAYDIKFVGVYEV